MAIDLTPSPEQLALQQGARAFAAGVLSKVKATIDPLPQPEQRFYATRPFYGEMAKAGFVAGLIPKEYGGGGMSCVDLAIASEELCVVDMNVSTTLLGTGLGLQPLIRFGTDEQKRRFLPDFTRTDFDGLASFAFTEVTGGANFDSPDPEAGVRTFARREGDQWVINGQKHFTTNGAGWEGKGPHLFTVVCRTDPHKPPQESLAIILVPGNTPGIEITGFLDTMGHRAVASPRVHFNDVRVPVGNIIGKPGDGIAMTSRTFSWTAALIGAACTAVMRAAFDAAYEFVKTDRRGGSVPVIEYQNAGYMLADLKIRLEAARYLTWKACHNFDVSNGKSEELAVMTKIHTSELCVQVVYDAMRLVGVNSYVSELTPLAGLMQEALCFPLYDGGNMGVRRRWLHKMFRTPGYDPMAASVT